MFVYVFLGFLVVATVVWASTGFYTVQPGEQGVLRLFGARSGVPTDPGLNWFPPRPIGSRTIVRVDEVRRLELGFRGDTSVPIESLMITGDENIVDVQLLVQFDIKDPEDFLFNVVDPDGVTMRDVAETVLREVVGSRDIREVKLQNVNPPGQVQDAFDEVVRAKEEKERVINLADAYEEEIIPRARGEAARLIEAAEAFKALRVNLAIGQAEKFIAILNEYRKAPEVTRQRLYLEAMEEVLPGVTKFIVDPGTNIVVVTKETDAQVVPIPAQ